MARFTKDKTIRRCDFCGRKGTDNVKVKYQRDASKPRSVTTRQIFICSTCGSLIYGIGFLGDPGQDRTVRYQKELP
jgi:hypothetical protein